MWHRTNISGSWPSLHGHRFLSTTVCPNIVSFHARHGNPRLSPRMCSRSSSPNRFCRRLPTAIMPIAPTSELLWTAQERHPRAPGSQAEFPPRHGDPGRLSEACLLIYFRMYLHDGSCLAAYERHLSEPFEWKRWCGWAHVAARFQFSCMLLLIMWSAIEARDCILASCHIPAVFSSEGRDKSLPNPGWQPQLQTAGLR